LKAEELDAVGRKVFNDIKHAINPRVQVVKKEKRGLNLLVVMGSNLVVI